MFTIYIVRSKYGPERYQIEIHFSEENCDGLSLSIYKDSPTFDNVTGLKSLDDIENYKLETEKLFTQKVVKVRIDNNFFSKKDCKNVDMCSLHNYIKMIKIIL